METVDRAVNLKPDMLTSQKYLKLRNSHKNRRKYVADKELWSSAVLDGRATSLMHQIETLYVQLLKEEPRSLFRKHLKNQINRKTKLIERGYL